MLESRPLGKKSAADDTKGKAGIAALQESNGRLNRGDISRGMPEEVGDGRGHRGAPAGCSRTLAEYVRHACNERGREQPQEQAERGVGLCQFEPEVGCMKAQKAHQVRRRRVWRVQLDHRRRDEQQAHGACSLAHARRYGTGAPGASGNAE